MFPWAPELHESKAAAVVQLETHHGVVLPSFACLCQNKIISQCKERLGWGFLCCFLNILFTF